VGYDLNQLAHSLDVLTSAGLVVRSQNPTHAARLYVLKQSEAGWLAALLDIASTREGREKLIQAMRAAAEHDAAAGHDDESAVVEQFAKKMVAR
jgi:hypothetical protein